MKKLIGLLVLGFVVFVVIYRQRVFLRDPLASVTRDGHKQGDVKVFINFNNDILMDDGSMPARRIYLVEGWNRTPMFLTTALKGINGLAYMTDTDQAAGVPVAYSSNGHRPALDSATMTNKQVQFVDEDGALVNVSLR